MSDNDYPRMLYRKGGSESCHDLECETMVVNSPEMEGMIHADGWRRTPAEAHGQKPEKISSAQVEPAALTDLQDQLAAERARADGYEEQLADLRASAAADSQAADERFKAETEARILAEMERDEAREALAKFDRDGDGQAGGSKKRG